jgi:NAD(P)H dehydrogenase (quinone)
VRAVLVHCHPVEGSFSSALRDAARRGLQAAGHDVTVLDLSAESFRCVMTRSEWEAYMAGGNETPGAIVRHVDAIRAAEMLVFTYPTWWSGLPAQLKGWLERVMMPGVAFTMENDRIRPALGHVRRIIVISTYGSPWPYVKAVTDARSRAQCVPPPAGVHDVGTSGSTRWTRRQMINADGSLLVSNGPSRDEGPRCPRPPLVGFIRLASARCRTR